MQSEPVALLVGLLDLQSEEIQESAAVLVGLLDHLYLAGRLILSHSNIHYCSCYAQGGFFSEMMFYLHRILSAFYIPIFSQHRIFRNLDLSASMSDSQQSGKC